MRQKALDRCQAYLETRPDDDEVQACVVETSVDLGHGGSAGGHARLLGTAGVG